MGVDIKVNLNQLIGVPKDVQKEFLRKNSEKDELASEIAFILHSGTSAAKGKKWKQYSKPYADREKKGQRKPVNMFLSGETLKALRVHKTRKGTATIEFRGRKVVAKYFNALRQIFPASGQSFKPRIQKVINKLATTAAIRVVFKANR